MVGKNYIYAIHIYVFNDIKNSLYNVVMGFRVFFLERRKIDFKQVIKGTIHLNSVSGIFIYGYTSLGNVELMTVSLITQFWFKIKLVSVAPDSSISL